MATSVADLVETAQRAAWDLAHDLPAHNARSVEWNRDLHAYLKGWERMTASLDRALDGTVALRSLRLRELGLPQPLPRIAHIADLIGASHDLLIMTPHSGQERSAYRDSIAAIGETVARITHGHLERTTTGLTPEQRHNRTAVLEHAIRTLRGSTATVPDSRAAALPDVPVFLTGDHSLGATVDRWQRSLANNPALSGPAIAPQALQAVAIDAALIVRTMRHHGGSVVQPQTHRHLELLSHGWVRAARSWGVATSARPPATHDSSTSSELSLAVREMRDTNGSITHGDVVQAASTLNDVSALYLARCKEAAITRSILLPATLVAHQRGPIPPSVHHAARRQGWVPAPATNQLVRDVLAAAGALQPLSRHLGALVEGKPRPLPATPHGPGGLYERNHLPGPTLG